MNKPRKRNPNALWQKEIEHYGINYVMKDRLTFHCGLSIEDVMKGLGVSRQTARKHTRRLIENNDAIAINPNFIKPTHSPYMN